MALPSLNFIDQDVLTVVRSFLLNILPQPIEVIQGQVNRVAEPATPDFVVMMPMFQRTLEFVSDYFEDCSFIASVAPGASILTVTEILIGTIVVGNNLLGLGVPSGLYVSGSLTGSGGVGTYQLSGTLSGGLPQGKYATGVFFALAPTEWTIQLDVHGPNSANNAVIITTLWRDNYAVEQFAQFQAAPPGWNQLPPGGGNTLVFPFNAMAPLWVEDARQAPFINAEEQYENRWVIDAKLQTNQVVTVSQQFADTVDVGLLNVDVTFP